MVGACGADPPVPRRCQHGGRDPRSVVRSLYVYRPLEPWPSPAAFAAIVERARTIGLTNWSSPCPGSSRRVAPRPRSTYSGRCRMIWCRCWSDDATSTLAGQLIVLLRDDGLRVAVRVIGSSRTIGPAVRYRWRFLKEPGLGDVVVHDPVQGYLPPLTKVIVDDEELRLRVILRVTGNPIGGSEGDRQVHPGRLIRSLVQQVPKPLKDRSELVVPKGPDEDAAGVRPARLGPVPKERSEVTTVAGDEDPPLRNCERQHFWIGESLELGPLTQRPHVVAVVAQWAREATTRQVGVKQQAHPR